MNYNIIEFETYGDSDAYGYPVKKYLKGITIHENGRFELDLTENPEGAYRFNDLINCSLDAGNNIFNLCKKYFAKLQPKIKKLNISVE